MVDSASLLWRLTVYGYPVPKEIWEEAAAYAERSFPKSGIPFADVHMALVAAATGNRAGLEQRIGDLEDGKLPQGFAVPAICRGAQAFADADYAGCVRFLEPVADEMVRIGGSHAQHEVIEDTLLVALLKSDELCKARALLDRRLHRRPSPRDMRWRTNFSA